MLKYRPEALQKAINNCSSHELLDILSKYYVNPKTIREIAVIDGLTVLKISARLYATSSLSSGYIGAGPAALKELMELCGCANKDVFTSIEKEKRVHFRRNENGIDWHLA